ncbi:MAG: ATP-binding protein, partial [Pygmaiobacter massiliensis]
MAKKQFKAESKRLLELMINSIYTNREIFLRELISNASDATDKLYYNALKAGQSGLSREELFIDIAADREARTLTISDHGCGMSKDELEQNLGTIAKSGSLAFKKENELAEGDVDIIGQFGVGFYAAFMVAKHVTVVSRAAGSEEAWSWASDGADGYTVTAAERAEAGTTITLQLKENTENEDYDEFLQEYRLRSLIKKYSDYIR